MEELYTLIAVLLGGAIAYVWFYVRYRYAGRPELYEVEKMARVIVVAAREMHELETNEERLDWASAQLQKYLNGIGMGFVDVRAMIEFALEQVKKQEAASSEDLFD